MIYFYCYTMCGLTFSKVVIGMRQERFSCVEKDKAPETDS